MKPIENLHGRRFHKLVVISKSRTRNCGAIMWKCKCDCGKIAFKKGSSLVGNRVKSCGCLTAKHKKSKTKEYGVWARMITRCERSNLPDYRGRGIRVCKRWLKFENFYADMGPRPSDAHSLDRINNNGNYTPSNCRWATISQQANNKRSNVWLTYAGRRKTLAQWAKYLDISYQALQFRRRLGWPIDQVLGPRRKEKHKKKT